MSDRERRRYWWRVRKDLRLCAHEYWESACRTLWALRLEDARRLMHRDNSPEARQRYVNTRLAYWERWER